MTTTRKAQTGAPAATSIAEHWAAEGVDALERRPQLARALRVAKKHKARIIVAKLDR